MEQSDFVDLLKAINRRTLEEAKQSNSNWRCMDEKDLIATLEELQERDMLVKEPDNWD